jgi:hypothetical protein
MPDLKVVPKTLDILIAAIAVMHVMWFKKL